MIYSISVNFNKQASKLHQSVGRFFFAFLSLELSTIPFNPKLFPNSFIPSFSSTLGL